MSRVRLYAVWLRVEFLNERSEFRNSSEGSKSEEVIYFSTY